MKRSALKTWLLAAAFAWTCGCALSAEPNLGSNTVAIPDIEPAQLAGLDGQLWLANDLEANGGTSIASVTRALRVEQYGVQGSTSSRGIAVSGDRVWFTISGSTMINADETDDSIGEFDRASGTIKRIPIPTKGSFPGAMTLSYDGKLFFVEENANAIGELRDGRVIEHRLPGGLIRDNSGPFSIAAGSDGIYFIEERLHRIGELTNSGHWRLLDTNDISDDSSLAATAEGVWFSDPEHRALGLIVSSNGSARIRKFAIPWGDAIPRALAGDRAGHVCFTTVQPYLGCYNSKVGFTRVSISDERGYYGVPDRLAIDGDKLWYSYHRLGHTNRWYGAIGFVNL
jgi:streptogramin lyase